jgi:uncharacterized protein YyaL (SSP411 family)
MPASPEHRHTNRLIHATSPYLLQHAHNPVDWYEWGEQAFAKALAEDKPIFLSIGYAACHWCHVMEHESFEDETVAAYLNEHFVSVKVDREERPDVDEIYMQVTQMLNDGRGGWPMSVFLMPDRRPIYAGTYFPRDAFLHLCQRVHEAWSSQREKVLQDAETMQRVLLTWATGQPADTTLISQDIVDRVAQLLSRYVDPQRGGFQSEGNKFPPSMAMELMLRVARRTGDLTLHEAVDVTLDHMARGGIYDHLGGGICRYSTDPDWLVPHFEKMLYDQALVASVYLDASLALQRPAYATVARDIFRYVLADLQAPDGGFYSSRDADSEGLEGAFYVWTRPQIVEVLGSSEADLCCAYFNVTEQGNWFESRGHAPEGPKNILHVTQPPSAFARAHAIDPAEFKERVAGWQARLLAARARRVEPGLDDKVLTAWNGLMIASLAKGAAVLDEPTYAEAAARAADFVLARLQRDGRLLRTYRNGEARLTGYLSDYAFFVEGLLNLYEATFDVRWLQAAQKLTDTLVRYYYDDQRGGFFFTASDAESLIARSKNPRDGAIPSGNSVQVLNLLRLAKLLDRKDYRKLAEETVRAFKKDAEGSPSQFERLLAAVDFLHDRTLEIAIVGPRDDKATQNLVRAVHATYLPNKVLTWSAAAVPSDHPLPLLRGKTPVDGMPAAYVCENYACQKPVTTPAALAAQLAAVHASSAAAPSGP